MRILTDAETYLVAGGDGPPEPMSIVVTARGGFNPNDFFYQVMTDIFGPGNAPDNPGAVTPPNHNGQDADGLTPEKHDNITHFLDAQLTALKDFAKDHPNYMMRMGGDTVSIQTGIEYLEHLSTALQTSSLIVGIQNNDKGVIDAVAFLAGLTAGAAASEGEAPALAVAALSQAAEAAVAAGGQGLVYTVNAATGAVEQAIQDWADNHPLDPTADDAATFYQSFFERFDGGGGGGGGGHHEIP